MRGLLDRLDEEDGSTRKDASDVRSRLSGWSQKDGEHAEFHIAESIPLEHVRDLGQGAHGTVDEVRCRGELVARKKILYKREQFPKVRNELNILQKLGGEHKHIIKFVGSYSQIIPGGRLLGLLLWPVAVCDLAAFLDELSEFQGQVSSTYLASLGLHTSSRTALVFLKRTYGCLANAISYLHNHKIRHKDLKPQNILLSKEGVYITDFGISLDFEELSQSVTDGLERGTPKYFAPELEGWGERGRPADVYSLGCIYLEIATVLCGETLKAFWGNNPFLYRKEQERIQQWMEMLREKAARERMEIHTILPLIERMLCVEPGARPRATEVASELYKYGGTPSVLHSPCCNGLSLLEELFNSVAVAKLEERQLKVQVKGLETKVEELSRYFNEREQQYQSYKWDLEVEKNDIGSDFIILHNRERRLTQTLSTVNAEKDGVQKELDELKQANAKLHKDLRISQTRYEIELGNMRQHYELILGDMRRSLAVEEQKIEGPNSQAEDFAATWEPRTERTEHEKTDNYSYPYKRFSVSDSRELRGKSRLAPADELSTRGHDTRAEDEEYRKQDGKIHSTSRDELLTPSYRINWDGTRKPRVKHPGNPPNHPVTNALATHNPHIDLTSKAVEVDERFGEALKTGLLTPGYRINWDGTRKYLVKPPRKPLPVTNHPVTNALATHNPHIDLTSKAVGVDERFGGALKTGLEVGPEDVQSHPGSGYVPQSQPKSQRATAGQDHTPQDAIELDFRELDALLSKA